MPYATISFGNGNGLFADDEGGFYFTKKLYPDIDTLFITALGYKEKKVPTANLEEKIFMVPEVNHLKEVVVKTKVSGKFKIKQRDPVVHDDYFHCWLPTIESEIAVFFDHKEEGPQKISKLYLPIKSEASDWNKRKSSKTSKKPFSTLFKVNFYENNDGLPGESLISEEIVFIVNEKNKKGIFQLNLDDKDIFVPRSGIFVSIQILGYTDKQGKLLPNKKYKEVKTKRGIVKVSTTFRPLLPFTNKIASKKTYVKRIFLNSGKWVRFERKNIQKNNKLLQQGYNNYGMGLELKVYNKQKE
ncbi:MAG: hypothetical protein HRT68_06440 [Flavobacteriaceae bacterium]|nr:hypothetical protein [Flavobacteriaceae bacterium]